MGTLYRDYQKGSPTRFRLHGTDFHRLCRSPCRSVAVSDNLYKNAMGVFVPGTGQIGLPIAAAVGALGGNPDAGLEVLATVTPAHVKEAMTMIENGCVSIERADSPDAVYCSATAFAGSDSAQVTVQGDHTGIVDVKMAKLFSKKNPRLPPTQKVKVQWAVKKST